MVWSGTKSLSCGHWGSSYFSLRWRCTYFSAFYLATCPCLFLGGHTCLLDGRLTFLPVTLGVCSASKSFLLLHISTPLPVQLIRMHSDPNGGSIAEEFCLSITRIGCYWITNVFAISNNQYNYSQISTLISNSNQNYLQSAELRETKRMNTTKKATPGFLGYRKSSFLVCKKLM